VSGTGIDELLVRFTQPDAQVRNVAVMDLIRVADDARAREALLAAYLDPATPARVAHAAILAHDGFLAVTGRPHGSGR
jgi:hypothetical protein